MAKTMEELQNALCEKADEVSFLEYQMENIEKRLEQYKSNPTLAAHIEILQAALSEFNRHSRNQYEIHGVNLWVLHTEQGDFNIGPLENMTGFKVTDLSITIFNEFPFTDWHLKKKEWTHSNRS